MKVNHYISYTIISIIWLLLELSIARYVQYSGIVFLTILINLISMIMVSYRPSYHTYLFIVNVALLTYLGFILPIELVIIYSVVLSVSIILYLVLIGMIEPMAFILSLLLIYVSYIIGKVLIKMQLMKQLIFMVSNVGINGGLFGIALTWYISSFIISIIIMLILIILGRKLRL
ncbi:MAG: hypothetical protein ACP5NQ_05120 [Vulcanisaeta sp.]